MKRKEQQNVKSEGPIPTACVGWSSEFLIGIVATSLPGRGGFVGYIPGRSDRGCCVASQGWHCLGVRHGMGKTENQAQSFEIVYGELKRNKKEGFLF